MMKPWSIERQLAAGFAAVLAIVLVSVVLSWRNAEERRVAVAAVTEAHALLRELEVVLSIMLDAETGMRGYLLTAQSPYLEPYLSARPRAQEQLRRIEAMTADRPNQRLRLQRMQRIVEEQLAYRDEVIAFARAQDLPEARKLVGSGLGKSGMDQLRALLDEARAAELALLGERAAASVRSDRYAASTLNLLIALILAIVVCGYLIIRRHLAARREAESEVRRINAGLEQQIEDRTAALRRNEARLRTIVENLSEGVVVSDLEGRLLHFNRAAIEMRGFQDADAYKRTLPQFAETFEFSGIDGTPLAMDQWPLARVLHGEILRELEVAIRHKVDGWQKVFSYSGALACATDGTPLMAVITMRDVTERKRAERRIDEQLQDLNLLDRITRAIGERQDLQSIFQVVVRTLEDSLPVDYACICMRADGARELEVTCVGAKGTEQGGVPVLDVQASIDLEQNGLARCMQGYLVYEPDIGTATMPFTQRLVRAGLRSLVLAPLRAESAVFGVLLVARRAAHGFSSHECEFLRQLSEHAALAAHQAQLHAALQRAYDDLRRTQQAAMQQERLRALGQMASGIAHDINNALSPVSLYAESLLETEQALSTRARGYLTTIQRAVDDVAKTVARMREYYRPRELQLELTPVDLNQLVSQVVDLTRARWNDMPQRQGIVVRAVQDLAPELPRILGVDSEIRDALTNLVLNAVDAMPAGGCITLRTRAAAAAHAKIGGDTVTVEVADEGVGMDAETRRRCLEPFFTTKGERGTGLGLVSVLGMAQRHGAEIEIDSAPGTGTCVRLVFAAQCTRNQSRVAAHTPVAVPRRMRLLLVDDDPLLLKSLSEALQFDGHEIVAANGGEAGIAAFRGGYERAERWDAVITDLGMPRIDGRKVAAAVKALSATTPVILLTGWGQRLVAESDVPECVDCVLAKPPRLAELRSVLARYAPMGARTDAPHATIR